MSRTRRQIYEDKLRRRSLLIAGASSLAVFAAIIILVPWPGVGKGQIFFNWSSCAPFRA